MKKIKLWIVREADTLAFAYSDYYYKTRKAAEKHFNLLGRQLGVYSALMSIEFDSKVNLENFIFEEMEYINVWEFPERFNPEIIKQK